MHMDVVVLSIDIYTHSTVLLPVLFCDREMLRSDISRNLATTYMIVSRASIIEGFYNHKKMKVMYSSLTLYILKRKMHEK
jgi:hypothetical protein